MAKVKLDIGATVDFLNKDELEDALSKNAAVGEAAEYAKIRGIKYIRAPRVQGTVYNGTIGGSSTTIGTQGLGGPPWGPQQGYAWSVRRIAVGGLANVGSSNPDVCGIYRNNTSSPPMGVVNANQPMITFPTLGCVLLGGDSLLLGQIPNQITSNTAGTLVATYLQADFDVIEVPSEMLGKLA
jgi:hypothetical protein